MVESLNLTRVLPTHRFQFCKVVDDNWQTGEGRRAVTQDVRKLDRTINMRRFYLIRLVGNYAKDKHDFSE